MPDNTLTLWGSAHSLYTGKVRSYLIKKGLPFQERTLADPRFATHIVPAIGLMVVPVVELADGTLLQDSADIIEALEQRFTQNPMLPDTALQRCVARLLDAFGTEGMLAPAMHYRWSYRAQQERFLQAEFGRAVHQGSDRAQRLAAGSQLMDFFNGFLPALGVTPETIPAIETAYRDLLDALDLHFQSHPYLLGARPSVADFGLMAPLYAHLARDPVPATLMKNLAPNVLRWTERMNLAHLADGEFAHAGNAWLPDDAIPATLEPVLALVFQDWGPQWLADAACLHDWLRQHPGLPAGHPVHLAPEKKVHPTLGPVSAPLRGVAMPRASAPHGLWLLDKALQLRASMDAASTQRMAALEARTGGTSVMALQLARGLQRRESGLVLT